jgi:hypothetical protein
MPRSTHLLLLFTLVPLKNKVMPQIIATTEGVFCGLKTGTKKNSADAWIMLQFKVPQNCNGYAVPADAMSMPNLSVFSLDGFDHTSLQKDHKYRLDLEVGARISNNRAFPEFKLMRIQPQGQRAAA